jgi:hypothetical protein
MTPEQIVQACQRAGLPRPVFSRKYATIRVMIGPDVPKFSSRDLDRWCGPVGHAGVARFINARLGTNYALGDVVLPVFREALLPALHLDAEFIEAVRRDGAEYLAGWIN